MILEEETFRIFGYYPSDLKPQSNKRILTVCDNCGKVREASKNKYHALCKSCAMSVAMKGHKNALGYKQTEEQKAEKSATMKGHKVVEETKVKISAAMKGNKNHNFGKNHTEETKALLSIAMKGEKNHNWKGGKKIRIARNNAKRSRELGYMLLMPLAPGEIGHHITNSFVIGIPAEVHKKFAGVSRKKHRTLVLQWLKNNDKNKYALVLIVLSNETEKQI